MPGAAELFPEICPGRSVTAPRPPGSTRHPLLGPVVQAWEAWAADPVIRHAGSSGGVLTALTAWLAETGEAAQVVAAAAAANPARTQTVTITDPRAR